MNRPLKTFLGTKHYKGTIEFEELQQ